MAEEQKFQCTGNCLACIPAQRAYCASQHTYNNMRTLEQLLSEVFSMKDGIKALSEKIEAMQNNEASVFDPMQEVKEKSGKPIKPTAQEGDGAENRSPEIINSNTKTS